MCRIKIPQQYFALKMQGREGLMRDRGRICGTLRYTDAYSILYVEHSSTL